MKSEEITVDDALVIPLVCTECGVVSGVGWRVVYRVGEAWSCWGRNCFDFNFRKDDYTDSLCDDCESNSFYHFECCGALVDHNCMYGAEEVNDDDEFIGYRCPNCETLEEI